jgi:tRNA U34 5-methylaminomethyl-2-thiouridine-forming methyltransferase MnmC
MDITDEDGHLKGELGHYQLIDTEDGHQTLYSEHFDENCHSLAGAYEETDYNYIQGCDVVTIAISKQKLTILEVGFGMGIGYRCTIDKLSQELNAEQIQNLQMTFLSVELDPSLIEFAQNSEDVLSSYFPSFKDLKEYQTPVRHFKATQNNKVFIILIGDARKTLEKYMCPSGDKFDCIYQDPFSPKKNPVLWTKEWFSILKRLSHIETKLSTYSSSTSVRKTLIESGWSISNHKGYKTKKTCTHATLNGKTDPVLLKGLQSEKISILYDN